MTAAVPEELTEYPLSVLLTPPAALDAPADFDAFWRETFAEFGTGDVAWEVTETLDSTSSHRVERILFASSTGERAVAWLALPHGPVSRGRVVGHGYGGRTEPALDGLPADTAAIFPVAPGQEVNPPGRFPALSARHVLAGIGRRDTYSHRFSAADLWRAATVLLDAAPDAAGALDYLGGSFGGGMGALALPWDHRFRRASLDVPSFGHFPIRLSRRCTGSGEAVRQHLRRHPEVRPVLDYFDAAIAASRIRIPVHVGAAVVDPSVDPRGQFAVYHALAGPKRLTVRGSGHLEGPIEELSDELFRQGTEDFFALSRIDQE
ncbi:acetylxylan esterase [Microbacterium sp. CIAB417]|uniref:acetylxylan esterase n=1 Tax=Microbacterium sp. CIAB417 TaxID=2860287 RepID=UPI001FACCF2F|nr:acetylxylan esterase [Microbacterium sp. CIAB417]